MKLPILFLALLTSGCGGLSTLQSVPSTRGGVGSCNGSLTPVEPPSTIEALNEKLRGVWIDCHDSGDRRPLGPTDAKGLEFVEDGHWYFLDENLARLRGPDVEGTFEIHDYAMARLQLDFNYAGGGGNILHWYFGGDPLKVRFDAMGVSQGLYMKH